MQGRPPLAEMGNLRKLVCSAVQVFIPEHKWGPMSHLPLAQESMKEMLHHLEDAVGLESWPWYLTGKTAQYTRTLCNVTGVSERTELSLLRIYGNSHFLHHWHACFCTSAMDD